MFEEMGEYDTRNLQLNYFDHSVVSNSREVEGWKGEPGYDIWCSYSLANQALGLVYLGFFSEIEGKMFFRVSYSEGEYHSFYLHIDS